MSNNIFYWTPPSIEVVISTSHKVSQYDRSFDVGVYKVLANGEWPKDMDTEAMCKELESEIRKIVRKYASGKPPNEPTTDKRIAPNA